MPSNKWREGCVGRAGEKGGKDTGIYKACDWEKLNPGLLVLPSSPHACHAIICNALQEAEKQNADCFHVEDRFNLFSPLCSDLPLQ